jgi:hypothetical protein
MNNFVLKYRDNVCAAMVLPVLSIQHSAFSIQHSAFSIQHSAFSIQHSAFSIQHSANSSLFPLTS